MIEFKVFKSLNFKDLFLGAPTWFVAIIWLAGFIGAVILNQFYFLLICGVVHFLSAMLVKYVDEDFIETIRDYIQQYNGDLE